MPVILPGESVVPEISFSAFDAAIVGDSLFSNNTCSPPGMSDPRPFNREVQASTVSGTSSRTRSDGFTGTGSA